jgi:hypothetical protein
LTTHQPWTWLEPGGRPSIDQVIEKKLNGSLPFIPPKFHEETTKPGILSLYHATISCFAFDPQDRPSSFQLAHSLSIALDWTKQSKHKTQQEVAELFNFQTSTHTQTTASRRARLLEVSSPKGHLVLPQQNAELIPYSSQNQPKDSILTDHSRGLSDKSQELLKEKNRQIAAAAARKRSIERRKVPRPKVGLMGSVQISKRRH